MSFHILTRSIFSHISIYLATIQCMDLHEDEVLPQFPVIFIKNYLLTVQREH